MRNSHLMLLFFSWLVIPLGSASEVFLLTKPLNFSSAPTLQNPVEVKVGENPTLIRHLSTSKGVSKVQIIQANGRSVNKVMYVSSKWFSAGTTPSPVSSFEVDPNVVLTKINPQCKPVEEEAPEAPQASPVQTKGLSPSCQVLGTENPDPEAYVNCLGEIKAKLKYKDSDSASVTISKLYGLHPLEQKFMAYILTMHGEASGMRPPVPHMAGVMKTIENRLVYARKKYPDANELDVVLQNLQFSMYNKNDPNWRRAIKATPQMMMAALTTYAKRNIMSIETSTRGPEVNKIYHYATTDLCNSRSAPPWKDSRKHVKLVVDGSSVAIPKGHMFFRDIPWTFSPNNNYRAYAKQEGIIQ